MERADEAIGATDCEGGMDCTRVLGEVVAGDGITGFVSGMEERAV